MSRTSLLTIAFILALVVTASTAQAQTRPHPENQPNIRPEKGVEVQLSASQTPLVFEPNRGQAAAEFAWIGRGAGFRFGINSEGATVEFRDRTATTPPTARLPFADVSQLTKPRTRQSNAHSTFVK